MSDDLEELKDRGAGRPASADVARLYHRAFEDCGPRALAARALAVDIEQAVRAAL